MSRFDFETLEMTTQLALEPTSGSRRIGRRSVLTGAGLAALSTVGLRRGAFATTEGEGEFDGKGTPEPGGTPLGSAGTVVVYSGRNENLVGELIEEFERTTGIAAEVRYGDTAELAATILDEGDNSPADLFFSQDAGALGALNDEGRLQALSPEVLELVDTRFRGDDGTWIGVSGRARVAVYNTDLLSAADLPASVKDLTAERWRGQVGWAPTNGSFQSFVTAFRVLEGDDAARAWLEGMVANEAVTFDGNSPITLAVGAGELPIGLVNHYYLYEVQAEENTTLPLANHFFAAGDPGALVNVAGAGVLTTATNGAQAQALLDYLLGTDAQTYFAEQTFEYPLIEGVPTAPGLIPLEEIQSPDIDLSDLSDLQGTLEMLTEVGVI